MNKPTITRWAKASMIAKVAMGRLEKPYGDLKWKEE